MAGQKAPPLQPPPAKNKHGPATAEELKKASKGVPLQKQYVPDPKPTIEGEVYAKAGDKLIEDFNAKWAGKEGLSKEQLQEKVDDFKDLKEGMKQLAAVEATVKQKLAASAAAKAKEKAAEQAKASAAKAAAEAKANAEKHKAVMAELGLSETQAEGFSALVSMLGGNQKDVVQMMKKYADEAKAYGYPISGFECALVKSYSDGSYGSVNKALRSDKWTAAQHLYVAMVNKAVKAMPKYTGQVIRNTHLTAEQIAYYSEGHVIQEKALMSTSNKTPNGVFSGNVRFVIQSKGKRASSIKKLSHYGGEDEVLFAAKTYFKVNKVEKLSSKLPTGADTVIHMEEWDDLD